MKCAFRSVLFSIFIFFVGCGEFVVDDKEIVDNNRTQDITFDNAEELVWNAFHGAGTTFRQSELQNGLDASFFGSQAGVHNCAGGGEINYQYSAAPGDVHRTGDTLSLEYTDCIKANGNTFNGQISGRYTEVEGYNDAFTGLTMDQCVARVADKETVTALVIDDQADTVVFDRQGSTMYVRYQGVPLGGSGTPIDKVVYTIDETERVIVINRSNADYDSSLSSKGAQIFFVDNFDVELIDCQYSKREIELLVKDLSVQGRDVSSTLNSTITLQHYFRSPSNQDLVLAFQSASISLVKNNYRVNIGVRAAKGDDAAEFRMEYDPEERNTFSMKFDGEMSVVGSLDVVEYATFVPFPGDYAQDIMIAGQLRVLGRDLESVTMNVDNDVAVRFSVIAEGDIDGDFRPDQSGLYGSSWSDFLDRDFVRPAL